MGYVDDFVADTKWSLRQNYFWTLILDLLLVLIGFKIIPGLFLSILEKDVLYQYLQSNTLVGLTPSIIPDHLVANTYGLVVKGIVFALIVCILVFVIYCLTRAVLWNYIVRRSLKVRHTGLFMKGNLVWVFAGFIPFYIVLLIWGALWYGMSVIFNSSLMHTIAQILVWALVIAFINLTFVFYYELARHSTVKAALSSAYTLGVKKIHQFVGAYVCAVIASWIVFKILVWLSTKVISVLGLSYIWYSTAQVALLYVIGLLLISWFRFYVDAVVSRLTQHRVISTMEKPVKQVKKSKTAKKSTKKRSVKKKAGAKKKTAKKRR